MTRPRRETPTTARVAVPWTVAVLVLTLVVAARAAVDRVIMLEDIRIEGNATIPEEKILTKILSKPGRALNRDQVEADYKSLMKTGWFSNVHVDLLEPGKDRKGHVLVFTVNEMPVLEAVEFRGRTKIKLKDLEDTTGLKKGARADHVKNAVAVGQIKHLYEEKGYDLAEVRLVEGGKPGDRKAIFEIFEGPKCQIGGFTFTGNTFVGDATLRTKISSRTKILGFGGKFDRKDVEDDARKLRTYYQGQGFFEVKVTPVISQGPTVGDYRIEFVIWEGVRYRVRNIAFDGNKLLTTPKLRDGMVMHSGQPFSDAFKDADAKLMNDRYGEIGCIDVQIEPERKYTESPGVIDIVYHIDEGRPYFLGRFIVKGNERTRDKVIRREAEMAGLLPGEPLNMKRVETYRKRIMNLRYFGTNNGPQGGPGGPGSSVGGGTGVDIRLANRREPDQPYSVSASQDESVVQASTRFQSPEPAAPRPAAPADDAPLLEPGPALPNLEGGAAGPGPAQPFGLGGAFDPPPDAQPAQPALPPPSELLPPGRRLGGARANGSRTPPIGAGENVDFPSTPGNNMTDVGPDRMEPFPNRAYADIVTQVDEGPTGRLMFGVGASSFQGLSGSLILHESNFDITAIPKSWGELFSGQAFRGGGQDFRIELTPGTVYNRAVVSFYDPYLFDLPVGFGTSAYAFNRVYADWTESRAGGRFSIGRQFGTQTYADVAFRVENVDFYSFRFPAPADYLAAAGHTTLATIRPSLRFDNRNDPFAPNKGQYVELAFEEGWGTFTYPKFTAEGRQYFLLGSRPDGSGKRTLTTRGYFGVTGRDTPVYERFFAGDFRSMRGFAYRGVGPHVLGVNTGGVMELIGSVEYQFPWMANDKLQQVVFTDFGWVEPNYTLETFRMAVGTGLRIYLPQQMFGPLPLSFDLAFPVVKGPQDHVRYFNFFIGSFW
jgi:outer membrane protein insertion porin family